jgi:uncharacterized protein YceK
MKHFLPILAVSTSLGVSGCGTIATHAGGGDGVTKNGSYRGITYDCRHLTDDQGGGILIFDIPLSAVADTLVLPFDLSEDSHD